MTDTNPYATVGPNDGTDRTWREYFDDIRYTRSEVETDDDGVPTILVTRAATDEELASSRSAKAYLSAAQSSGFKTLLGYSKAFQPGHVIKSGESKGEFHPDKTIEQLWVAGHKENYGVFKIVFVRVNGDSWKASIRQMKEKYNLVSDKELKEWINAAN